LSGTAISSFGRRLDRGINDLLLALSAMEQPVSRGEASWSGTIFTTPFSRSLRSTKSTDLKAGHRI